MFLFDGFLEKKNKHNHRRSQSTFSIKYTILILLVSGFREREREFPLTWKPKWGTSSRFSRGILASARGLQCINCVRRDIRKKKSNQSMVLTFPHVVSIFFVEGDRDNGRERVKKTRD
jgi:hypothetical protein